MTPKEKMNANKTTARLVGALFLLAMATDMTGNIPGGLFELSLSIWLIVKGFNSEALTSGSAKIDQKQDRLSLSNA